VKTIKFVLHKLHGLFQQTRGPAYLPGFFFGLVFFFAFFPTFISWCGFGFIRMRAPINAFVLLRFSESAMTVTLDSILKNPRLKIQRANRHIDELRQRSSPLDRELYEIVIMGHPKKGPTVIHNYTTTVQITFRPKESIPEIFAGIIGDAVGNIREAFDHAASAIVDTWGTRPKGPLYFPITERKDLVSHTGFTAIEQAVPGFAELFLKEIRPENGPDERLWDFRTLNKDNKHNDFIPLVTVVGVNNINIVAGTNTFEDCGVSFDPTRPMVLFQADAPVTIGDDFETSIDVLFGERT
jgi:hypothetical protein